MVTRVKYAAFFLLEVVCALCVLVGAWLIYPPAAMILGGVVGVLAAEQSMADLKRRRKEARL
jgi:Flp pilus assembly protein TadB